MKCTECGSTMNKSIGDHPYVESGLDHVLLRNVATYRCPKCGEEHLEIERIGQLHRLLAEIIANKPARLIPSEVRFVRDHLALTNREFALLMGVTESQASRWTTSDPMSVPAEHFLRMLATMGPMVLASHEAPAVKIGKMDGDKFIERVTETLGSFPARDAPTKSLPVRIRRTAADWKAEVQAVAG